MDISWEPQSLRPREVALGLYVSLPGKATFTGMELEGALYDVVMWLDMTPEGVRPTSVTVTSQDGKTPVSGTTLRSLRVWDSARRALLHGISRGRLETSDSGDLLNLEDWSLSDEQVANIRKQGPTKESLEWTALFYNLAGVLGLAPARQVELNLGLSSATATRWIRRARAEGLLDEPRTGAPTPPPSPVTAEQLEAFFRRVNPETGEVSDG